MLSCIHSVVSYLYIVVCIKRSLESPCKEFELMIFFFVIELFEEIVSFLMMIEKCVCVHATQLRGYVSHLQCLTNSSKMIYDKTH